MTTDDELDNEQAEPDESPEQFADFDAFFAEQPEPVRTGMPFRLYGREWRLPRELGGMFALLVQRLQASKNPEDVRTLVGYLFGRDALDTFVAHGMDDPQFGTLLLWATENIRKPGSMTVAEADAERQRRDAAKGKAKARPKKSAAKRPTSGARS
ncbi:hypothetical protein ACFW4X_21085 [Streptomyces smyrnaeus]|uniref:hypothetical protein n=1 Tax=Streptomyces smyrnaeus TaxID=1387713 RepID=UPI00368C8A57